MTSNIQPVFVGSNRRYSVASVLCTWCLKQDPTSPLRSPSHASSGGREFLGGRANESDFHDGEAAVIVAQSEDSPGEQPWGQLARGAC